MTNPAATRLVPASVDTPELNAVDDTDEEIVTVTTLPSS